MKPRYQFVTLLVAGGLVFATAIGGFDDYSQTMAGLEPPPTIGTVSMVPDTTTTTVLDQPALPVTTTETVVRVDSVPDEARCPEWWHLLEAFWPEELRLQADRVIWAETRCQNLHRSDVGRIGYGDHGLFQINAINLDYLSAWGVTAEDLMNPAQNVVAALIIYGYAAEHYGCGWQPWYSSIDSDAMCDAVRN